MKNSRPSKRSNALTHRKTYANVRLRSSKNNLSIFKKKKKKEKEHIVILIKDEKE